MNGDAASVPGLTEQIANIEDLVGKLVIKSQEIEQSQQENMINGNTGEDSKESLEKMRQEMQEVVEEKERKMQEMMNKFSRNRQILTSNWEQAESEVRRLDDIYHDMVDRVVLCLAALPDLTQQHPSLATLVNTLQLERENNDSNNSGDTSDADHNNQNNLNGHVNKKMSRSLMNSSSATDVDITRFMSQSQILTNSSTSTGLLSASARASSLTRG